MTVGIEKIRNRGVFINLKSHRSKSSLMAEFEVEDLSRIKLVFPSGPLPSAATAETSTLVHGTKLLSLLTGRHVIKQHQSILYAKCPHDH